MKVGDWFAFAVRVAGITVLLPGLGLLLDALLMRLGYFNVPETHPAYYLIYGTAQVVAGLYLIWGAPLLVWFAYPRGDEVELDAEEE